jgi:hypothetical protein
MDTAAVANRDAVLTDISWRTYQTLLADIGDRNLARLTY